MEKNQIREYLEFYRDLGFEVIYRRATRADYAAAVSPSHAVPDLPAPSSVAAVALSPGPALSVAQLPELPSVRADNDSLALIREDIGDCQRCRLSQGRKNIVFGVGNQQAKLVFVGEGPGADEDEQGIPFVGRAGQLLTQMIENTAAKEGIPILRADVYICNVVKCRPPENRTPLPDEMETCGQFLSRQLNAIQPKAICVLGATAMKALLGVKEGITRLRGQWHRWNGIPVMITYHPSYLLRQVSPQAKRDAWQDLKAVLHYVYD
jgi:uracil-DNA glycosylase family 4